MNTPIYALALFIAVMLLEQNSAYADVTLTTDGKVLSRPFEYLQNRTDDFGVTRGTDGAIEYCPDGTTVNVDDGADGAATFPFRGLAKGVCRNTLLRGGFK